MRRFLCTFLLAAMATLCLPACSGSSKSADGPVLSVNPETLDFGSVGSVLSVDVSNAGIGTLEWTASSLHSWLEVSPEQGSQSGTVKVTVNRNSADLFMGPNTGGFLINSNGGNLKVELTVTKLSEGDPELDLVPFAIDFGQVDDVRSMTVFNRGGGELVWQAASDQPWLTIDPSSGVNDEIITLTADRASLSPGMYRAHVNVSSNGGDMSMPVDLLMVDENIDTDLRDFMPMAVGNKWTWWQYKSMVWWSFEIVATFQRNGVDVWTVQANDSHGGYKDFWFVYASGTLNVVTNDSTLDRLPDMDVSAGCRYWTEECDFPLFHEDLRPRGEFNDPYWRQNAAYVPGSLSELLDFYGVYDSDIALDDFPLGDQQACIGVTEEYDQIRHLYTVFAPGMGPVMWDYWPLVYARIAGVEYGTDPVPYEQGVTPYGDPNSETLFYAMDQWSNFTWVQGTYVNGKPVPSHAILSDDLGEADGVVFFNEDFLPIQWIFEGTSISVHNVDAQGNEGGVFDPTNAFHLWMDENGPTEFRANIYPDNISDMLDYYEWVASEDFTHVRQFLTAEGISTFDQLVALAKQSGPNQIRYQSVAMGLGAAAAESAYYHLYEGSRGLFEIPINFGVNLLGDWLGDQLCIHCPKPGEPTVAALHCQGLDYSVGIVDICHYVFFWPEPSMPCVSSCMASMGCFTNICTPTELSAQAVKEAQESNGF